MRGVMPENALAELLAGLDDATTVQAEALHAQMLAVGLTTEQADEMLARTLDCRAATRDCPEVPGG
jgi:hypothetical protein